MPINHEYFPPLNIPSMGGTVRPKKAIVVWVDATKAFACKKTEIPADAKNLRPDGYPPLHIGERNLELVGDHLDVWAPLFKQAGLDVLATVDTHNWNDPLQQAELMIYPQHATEGSYETEIISAVAPYVDFTICKTTYDSFFETDLLQQIEALHEGLHPIETVLIVGGFVTHIVVASMAFRAAAMGYRVVVPSFLVGDFKRIHHNNFIQNVFPAWGVFVLKSEAELADMLGLDKDAADKMRQTLRVAS
jgi:nicotinamidase-related amidase